MGSEMCIRDRTQYIYNQFGQVQYILPPEAVKAIEANNNTLDQTILDQWCFQYKYDSRQRIIEKKVPGSAWEWMVYDQLDRLILSQDGNQRVNGTWSFIKYDGLNRPIMTGLWDGLPGQESRNDVQAIADAQAIVDETPAFNTTHGLYQSCIS